jgi:ATP/maltotriose-dependent transcriptional regulator MalT
MLSRIHLPIFDQRDTELKGIVHEVQLGGLDMQSCKEMMGSKKISEQDFKKIYSVTSGHPLALELIKSSGRITDFSDMMKFINEQVFQKLSKPEKAALMSLSVHRKPVRVQGFLIEDESDYDTIDDLINKTLLSETEPGRYDIHDLIREFFYSRLIAKKRNEYHLNAALFYDSASDDELDILEAVYHYINAGTQDKAADIMINKAPALIAKGYLDEAMNILTKFDSRVSTEYLARLYTLKGDILSTWGEWDNVFEYYWQCYFLNMLEKTAVAKKELLKDYGYIGWKPSEVEVAMSNLTSSLDVLSESGDAGGVMEIKNSLAWMLWMTGSYRKSENIYTELLDMMNSSGDRPGAGKILIKLGNVHWGNEKLESASKTYDEALMKFRELKDNYGIARTYNHLAVCELEDNNYMKAEEFLQKSIRISEQNQHKRITAYSKIHRIQSTMLQGNYKDALVEIEDTRATFTLLNDMLGLAYLTAQEGYIFKLSKQNKRAITRFENALHYLRGFLMPYYKSKLYSELSSLYKLTGESDKSQDAKIHAMEKDEQMEE